MDQNVVAACIDPYFDVHLPEMAHETNSDAETLKAVRQRLYDEGEALLKEAKEKIAAANKMIDAIRIFDPSFSPTDGGRFVAMDLDKMGPEPSVRRSRNTSGNRGGWTEHLIEELGGGPKSLDDLVATALTKWPDREESDIRTRLRVTLHAMQGRRVERDGDKWKVKLL